VIKPNARASVDAKMPRVILPPSCDGLVQVHQLLCGRDIAVDPSRNPMFGVAAQMANFVYLVCCERSGECLAVDCCWDVAGVVGEATRLGFRLVGGLYTHQHFDHVGGPLPKQMTGGRALRLEGVSEVAAAVAAAEAEAEAAEGGGHAEGTAGEAPRVLIGTKDAAPVRRRLLLPSGNGGSAAGGSAAGAAGAAGAAAAVLGCVEDGDTVLVGSAVRARVLATPGHTPGSLCVVVEAPGGGGGGAQEKGGAAPRGLRVARAATAPTVAGAGAAAAAAAAAGGDAAAAAATAVAVITGDTLFIGSCGRADLPGSSIPALGDSLRRLAALPDAAVVCPGHNYGPVPVSTIALEKAKNVSVRAALMGKLEVLLSPQLVAPSHAAAGQCWPPPPPPPPPVVCCCCAVEEMTAMIEQHVPECPRRARAHL